MNFLLKFPKVGFIFFPLLLTFTEFSRCQKTQYELIENLPLQLILPWELTSGAGYRDLAIDRFNYLYIGAKNRVLYYDLSQWHVLAVPGEVRLAHGSNDTLYAGGRDCFGFIGEKPDGAREFFNLAGDPVNEGLSIGQVSKIIVSEKRTYMLAEKGLFVVSGKKLTKVLPGSGITDIFTAGGELYLYEYGNGLRIYKDARLAPMLAAHQLAGRKIINVFLHDGGLRLLLDGNPVPYRIVDGTIRQVVAGQAQGNQGRQQDIFRGSFTRLLNDSLLLFSPDDRHFLLYNLGGVLVRTLGGGPDPRQSGVRDACMDGYGQLWILHGSAVSKTLPFPPIGDFHFTPGGPKTVNDLLMIKGTIYAAASNGMFVLRKDPEDPGQCCGTHWKVDKVFDRPVECYSLSRAGNSILLASNEGVFSFGTNQKEKLVLGSPAHLVAGSAGDTSLAFVALEEGIVTIRNRDGSWEATGEAFGPPERVNSIVEDGEGTIWTGTDFGAYSRESGKKENKPVGPGTTGPPVPVKVFNLGGKSVLSAGGKLFTLNRKGGEPAPHPLNALLDERGLQAGNLAQTDNGTLLMVCFEPGSGERGLLFGRFSGEDPTTIDDPVFALPHSAEIRAACTTLPVIWLSTGNGLEAVCTDRFRSGTGGFRTVIEKLIAGKDSVPLLSEEGSEAGVREREGMLKFPHSQDFLRFEFTSSELFPAGKPLFQYRFTDEDEWSFWSENKFAQITDPGTGNYRFSVRSKDHYGRVSDPVLMEFRIRPPLLVTWWALVLYAIALLFLTYLYRKWMAFVKLNRQYQIEEIVSERTEAIMKEKEQAETLLANILPKKTAEELKEKGKATSSKFKMVTVLFSDIQGFTKIAEQMNPEKLIDELDSFYFQFDTVVEKYNIEKIKTIGDAYMAAGGIPVKNRTNPVEVVLAGLEMQHYMRELKKQNAEIWDLRIGIHTGSVIAGVVGQKKFSYDIWGDTVNTASRMESSGEAGKVNISESTHELVKEFFEFDHRGKMPVKYKGDLDMFFVKGLKPEFRAENEYSGNEKLKVQLLLLRLLDIEEIIITRFEKETPEDLFYHNATHTQHVYTQVELLGRAEGVREEDLLILRTAALLHDIGCLENVEDHEDRSVEVARKLLPAYQFSEEQIDKICRLILVTKLPPEPKDLLEKIICDANLDHLGRVDFLIQSDKLFQEYRTKKLFKSKKDWNTYQIDFIRNHEFFTDSARKLREVSKEDQIENIRQFS